MAHLKQIDILIKEYKIWTIKLNNSVKNIENTILQNDQSDAVTEKIVSIIGSLIVMFIVSGIIGLIVEDNFGISVILFIVGLALSNFLNQKIFGKPRKFEELTDYEKDMLNTLNKITIIHTKIRDEINQNKRLVYFKDYSKLRQKFNDILMVLKAFDKSNLAFKYRTKYIFVVSSYQKKVKQFDSIFAHK
jgi:ABC-type multidrug transport system fused ATPase/permease subunit